MKYLSQKQICDLTGMNRSTIRRLEKIGLFPKRHLIGLAKIGWDDGEIQSWLTTRPVVKIKGGNP